MGNQYVPQTFNFAPAGVFTTEKACVEALFSKDDREVLGVLVWLAGRHRSLEYKMKDSYAEIVERVLARTDVKERLRDLRNSQNLWKSQGAELALNAAM